MNYDWKGIWMIPGIGATIVLVIFLIFFRDPIKRIVANNPANENS